MLNGSGMFGIDFWTPNSWESIDALSDLRGDVSGGGLGAENQTAVEHLTRKMS